jgi:hypothetical protein
VPKVAETQVRRIGARNQLQTQLRQLSALNKERAFKPLASKNRSTFATVFRPDGNSAVSDKSQQFFLLAKV